VILIGVIGSGAMGSGIAQVAATAGHEVLVFDSNAQALEKSKAGLEAVYLRLVEKQKISREAADLILKHIRFVSGLDEFKDCGLVIEAIVENLAVKQAVFAQLEGIVTADAILATNTSSLSITSIASACSKPERVMGIHFFNPAPLMPLVELIPGIATRAEVFFKAKDILGTWKKELVTAKDTPGFIVNRVARPFYGEAIRIYEEGFADFATIDWAMKELGGFKMGPFELMDMIGNDINYTVTETVWTQLFFDPRYKPSITQKRLFEAKRFGKKTGQGYYNYSGSEALPVPKKNNELGNDIFLRILCMLINEATEALHLKIATREDIDQAMTKGVNYPKGLLKWADEIGLGLVYKLVSHLHQEYGEDRYRPSILLKNMARTEQNFYQ